MLASRQMWTDDAMNDSHVAERDNERSSVRSAGLDATARRPQIQASGRAWFCANLLAVGAIGAAFWPVLQPGLTLGWAGLALLNVLFQLTRNAAPSAVRGYSKSRYPAAASRGFPVLLGFTWGAAVLLFLPYAAPTTSGALFAAVFAIALCAIPACNEQGETYVWFITPLTVLSLLALAFDARYRGTIPWVGLAAGILIINATAYFRPLLELRRALGGAVSRNLHGKPGTTQADEKDQRILEALGMNLAQARSIIWRASHDALTGVINRIEFECRLEKLLQHSGAKDAPAHSLLFIDVDHFKFINDSYGHAAGDVALKTLAELLRTRIRGADTLARVGGDEFAALLYSCGTTKARLIAENLRAAVEQHTFRWNAIDLPVSISIGIVEFDRHATCSNDIMHAADTACYSAKSVGRNRVQLFNAGDSGSLETARDFALVKEVQGALHDNRLQLFAQPLTETQDPGPARRCELSAGIRRNDGHYLHSAELADVARRFQLAAELDRWVVEAALDLLRSNDSALLNMELVFIPLTRQTMMDERVQQDLLESLRRHASLASRLGFVLQDWEDSASVHYFAASLKQLGCAIMVEDAGFGSRGIEVVKSLGADFLGIRGTLVRNIERSSVDYEAVLGLSRIARSLGMRTVAGQVDSTTLRAALAAMGVDLIKDERNGGPRLVTAAGGHH